MEQNLEDLLLQEISDEFEKLGDMEVGSDQYKVTVDGLTKLTDRAIELEKIQMEAEEKAQSREIDKELREKQLKDERTDKIVKNSISAAGIVTSAALAVWGTIKSIKFEETGTITTIFGRGWINKLLPKK